MGGRRGKKEEGGNGPRGREKESDKAWEGGRKEGQVNGTRKVSRRKYNTDRAWDEQEKKRGGNGRRYVKGVGNEGIGGVGGP